MPRLPVDGKKVVEHRITFGTKERELIQDLSTSYRMSAFSGNDSVVEVLGDGTKVIAALATLGALLELAGITDVFDFDEALKEKVDEVKEGIKEKIKDKATDPRSIEYLFKLSPFGIPFWAGGQVEDFVRDRI